MRHRAWRIGRGGADAVPADRLTAERLASFLSFLGSVSPKSSTQVKFADAPPPPQTAEPQTTQPQATEPQTPEPQWQPQTRVTAPTTPPVTPDKAPAGPTPVALVVAPDTPAPRAVLPTVSSTDRSTTPVSTPETATRMIWSIGRHRSASPPGWTVRVFARFSRRLQALGALALVILVSVVLLVMT